MPIRLVNIRRQNWRIEAATKIFVLHHCMSMNNYHSHDQYAPIWLSMFPPAPLSNFKKNKKKTSCIFNETDDSTVHILFFKQRLDGRTWPK